MAEILHHPRCHPNIEIMGVAGGSIKGATMQYMACGAGFQPSTVWPGIIKNACFVIFVILEFLGFLDRQTRRQSEYKKRFSKFMESILQKSGKLRSLIRDLNDKFEQNKQVTECPS